ncbi:MAG TPA: vanadium-dependent haloperoxidase [Gaiellaceae bacterium]|nr:vanadium-dependent haloperoxidase [Gaiellaceae bacterium]
MRRMTISMGLAATFIVVAVLALGSTGTSAAPSVVTSENAVVHWSGIAEVAIAAGRPPASSTVLAGMVHGAIYDAVAAVEGGLEPFATGVTAPPDASADAAVAQAARDVLVARVPGQAGFVQAAYDTYMASIPPGLAKDAGKAVGAAAAAGMLAMRTGDRFDDAVPYIQPTPGPGVFEPIAPATPVDVKLGQVRPFTYDSPSEYRPGEPFELTSKRYAKDVIEVRDYGRAVSTFRTPAQTEHSRFFTDQAYAQYSRAVRGVAVARDLDLRESARLLGYVWVAAADTMIACWEAKFHYYFWRPTHAIQRADTDGNPATAPDPTWLPLFGGNHPEYPSGHACITAAVTQSLKGYFGTKHVQLAFTSNVTGTTQTYGRLDDVVSAIEDARVWGGLHFRTTMTDTAKHFPRIAREIGRKHFLADPGRHDHHDGKDGREDDDD